RTELGDRRTKRLALLGVLQTDCENVFRGANPRRTQLQASDIENVECDDVAAADFTQQVFHGHGHVIEIDRCGGTAGDTHLVFFGSAGYAGKLSLDQTRGKL